MQGTLFLDRSTKQTEAAVEGAVATIVTRHAPTINREIQTLGRDAKRAELLRGMIPTLERKIADLRRTRLENAPKRQRQGMGARLDAANLERVVRALSVLADAHEAGTCPSEYADLRYRNEVEPLVTKRCESGGYYDVHESDKHSDESPRAVAFRAWVKGQQSGADAVKDAERARADRIKALEEAVRFAQIDGFFPTPPGLVSTVLDWALIQKGEAVLEPSAGKGDLAEAAKAAGGVVVGFEINHNLAEICKAKGLDVERADFMTMQPIEAFDKVVMNPPFEKLADVEHVRRAFQWLKPGGRLVAIMSPSFEHNGAARAVAFREWLDEQSSAVVKVEPGAFTGRDAFRQTGVACRIVIIDKQ